MNRSKILITLESMRYPNTGLHAFGKSLGKAIINQNKSLFDLNYFIHPATKDFDHDDVERIYYKKHHKFFFTNRYGIDLFHFADQHSKLKPKKVKGKKILTIHDINYVHENIGKKELKHYLKKLDERIKPCGKIIAISNFAANDILNYFPETADRLSVIYNGADKLHVTPEHQPAYVPKKPFLFTIGIVAPKKNFHVLPALLAGNDYQLIIAGIKTHYQDVIMQQAKIHGCADRLKLLGPVPEQDKAWYYKNCEAFVFPSIAEGFGLPVIEAMHFGKPVFLSDRTSLPEIGGDAAYYFKSFDAEDMCDVFNKGLQHFHQNDPSALIMANAAKYNWDKTAQEYLQAYKECLER